MASCTFSSWTTCSLIALVRLCVVSVSPSRKGHNTTSQQGQASGSQQDKRSTSAAFGGSSSTNMRHRNQGHGGDSRNYNRDQPFRNQEFQGDNRSSRDSTSGSWNSPKDTRQPNKGGKSRNRGNPSQLGAAWADIFTAGCYWTLWKGLHRPGEAT